ncbi:COP9 signalosome subunit 6 [Russula earlei]|uniref:COP9 signalosome subunit 6 n=1 Tax=Russula earlei TaxID=71964 RepID=A0ACC0UJH4_9AGAM|nr:COP9 signalosome subunit 6 [Russula earlei]
MDTGGQSVVLPSSTSSSLSLSLHPLPILNISEHLTRLRLQTNTPLPFVLGALLGTQNGREVEIVNSFEVAVLPSENVDHGSFSVRKEQYKQVFPSLEFIGWYTVASLPTQSHITLHEQFSLYCSNPLLLILQPIHTVSVNVTLGHLPIRAYEPTIEIRDHAPRSVYIEAPFSVETGEAERIAVDTTARGGEGGTSLESHLQTQRAAVKMLHDRILVLVDYLRGVLSGSAPKDHATIRSLAALVASLPASDSKGFRDEFETEYEDVQLTAYLSTLTKSTNILNDIVDKHNVLHSSGREERPASFMPSRRRGIPGRGFGGFGDWDRMF